MRGSYAVAVANPDLSLVVLAWDNLELTRRCVDSLRATTDVPYELIIVDNGSAPDAVDYAREAADVAVVNRANLGFATGMNRGLEKASGSHVAFINNDTEFPPAWATKVLESFRRFPSAGVVVPAVTAAGNPVTVRDQPGDSAKPLTPFGEFPSGVVYVLPATTIRSVGGWNDSYQPASAEDLDLAFTIWAHDLEIVLDERVLVNHESQATITRLPELDTMYARNLNQFLDRWESGPHGPLLDSVSTEAYQANLKAARAAVVWIRRMIAERDVSAGLRKQAQLSEPRSGFRARFRPR